jgi:hypothetical protein
MRRGRRFVGSTALGVLLLATAGRARAQLAPPPEGPAVQAAPAAVVDPRSDEVWNAYHEAFTALVRGDRARARQLLDAIMLLHPTHPAAALARSLAASSPPRSAPTVPRAPNGKTNAARAELIVFQTLHGVVAGLEVCAAAECSGVRSRAVSLMLMGGLGLGLSIGLSRDGVRPGDTAALDAGAFWGAWNGLTLAYAAEASGAHVARGMLLGQGLGLGAGLMFAIGGQPTAGQVSLANTVATWSTTMTLLVLFVVNDGHSSRPRDLWIPLALASDVGLASGAVFGRESSVSRGRMALIDVGGALGLLLGGLVSTTGDTTAKRAGVSMMAGTGAGLLAATLATMSWDAPGTSAPSPRGGPATTTTMTTMSFLPTPTPGGGAALTLGGTF